MKDSDNVVKCTSQIVNSLDPETFVQRLFNDEVTLQIEGNLYLKGKLNASLILAKNLNTLGKIERLLIEEIESSCSLVPDQVRRMIAAIHKQLRQLNEEIHRELSKEPLHEQLADKFDIPSSEFNKDPYKQFYEAFGKLSLTQKELRMENPKLLKSLENWTTKMRKIYASNIRLRDIVPPSNKKLY